MNIKLLIASIALTILIAIFFLNKPYDENIKSHNTDITELKIVNYIPEDNDFTIISNASITDFKEELNRNISDLDSKNFGILKNSILTLLGSEIKDSFYEIYDDEFALSFSNIQNQKKDITLIVKINEDKLNKGFINKEIKEENNSDEIINPSYFEYITITEDKYIIFSTNKKYIDEPFKFLNDEKVLKVRNSFIKEIPSRFKSQKILLIANNNLFNVVERNKSNFITQKLITTISSNNKKIILKTYLLNNNNFLDISKDNILNTSNKNINLIYTDRIENYIKDLSFLELDSIQKELSLEMNEISDSKILSLRNHENWLIGFSKENSADFKVSNLSILKNYNNYNLNTNNLNYKVWFRNSLENINDEIILKEDNKLFTCESDKLILISNNLSELVNGFKKEGSIYKYLDRDTDNQFRRYLINDMFVVNDIHQKEIKKYFTLFNEIKYLTSNYLRFSIQSIKAIISQKIPDMSPDIFIETQIELI